MPYFKILRPINFFFVMITTLFGSLYPEFKIFNERILFAMLSAALISGAGYVVNDYFDIYIDKINRPKRMIPSGKIQPHSAYMYAMLLFVFGLAFSFFTGKIACVVLAFLNTFLLFYYAKLYKKKFLLGNILVAYAASSTFLYGAFVTNNSKNIIPVLVVAFIFTLIREFIKDAQDVAGDKELGAKTLAVVIGKKKTILLSLVFAFVLLLSVLFMFYIKMISLKLTLLIILINTIPIILVLRDLYFKVSDKNFTVASNFLKVEMLFVLIIFYFEH